MYNSQMLYYDFLLINWPNKNIADAMDTKLSMKL